MITLKRLFKTCVFTLLFAVSTLDNHSSETNQANAVVNDVMRDIGRSYTHLKLNRAYLLATVSRENVPLYEEDALLLLRTDSKWILVHVNRRPRRGENKWGFHDVMDARWSGDRMFDHKPRKEEVEKFLLDSDWQWHSEPKLFNVVRRFVNENVWKEQLKMDPPVAQTDQTGINPVLY